jgi:glycerol kinase
VPGLARRAAAGQVLFGTVDSWLIWRFTGRHLTDVTNASRTLLMNLRTLDWDDDLLDALGVPRAMLPEIRPSAEVYGEARGQLAGVPVAAALGDQQAALFGQTCFSPGDVKCTYGTGSFLLLNTGERPVLSDSGLLTTVCCRVGEEAPTYALEGSIAVTGALVQWFRDNLELIGSAPEIETLARTVSDNGGCYFVPAFSGLFAPHCRCARRTGGSAERGRDGIAGRGLRRRSGGRLLAEHRCAAGELARGGAMATQHGLRAAGARVPKMAQSGGTHDRLARRGRRLTSAPDVPRPARHGQR